MQPFRLAHALHHVHGTMPTSIWSPDHFQHYVHAHIYVYESTSKTWKDKNVGIYPETKTPKWFKDELPDFTMEDLMIETISKFEFESEHVILQSFSTQSLLYLSQELKTDLRLIQLANRPITDDELKDWLCKSNIEHENSRYVRKSIGGTTLLIGVQDLVLGSTTLECNIWSRVEPH